MQPELNIIGCGRLGKTLGRLWHDNGQLTINQVLNTSLNSSQAAVEFIGAGEAAESFSALTPADLWLIASDDQSIATISEKLAQLTPIKAGDVVFHCSGALASDILEPVKSKGANIASVHPMHAFSSPQTSLQSFTGSYCAIEGDGDAITTLSGLFEAINGKMIPINRESKVLYHTASVIGSNFLVTLLDASLKTFEVAGIKQKQAAEILRPITHSMINAVLDTYPASALTGPIARGDVEVIEKQLAALQDKAPELTSLYRVLGQQNVELAKDKGQAAPDSLARLQEILLEQ